jgi:hypothetical protein
MGPEDIPPATSMPDPQMLALSGLGLFSRKESS